MNRTRLRALLVKHEDDRRHPYTCTAGHLTIGIGHNLEAAPLSDAVVELLFDEDVAAAREACLLTVPGFDTLSEARQHALLSMAFNLGAGRFAKFERMLEAIEHRNFDAAADEMLASTWAGQVGQRAKELAAMMRDG